MDYKKIIKKFIIIIIAINIAIVLFILLVNLYINQVAKGYIKDDFPIEKNIKDKPI